MTDGGQDMSTASVSVTMTKLLLQPCSKVLLLFPGLIEFSSVHHYSLQQNAQFLPLPVHPIFGADPLAGQQTEPVQDRTSEVVLQMIRT